MEKPVDITPENIVIIKDEFYYSTNHLIYKGDKSELYRGNKKTTDIFDYYELYGISLPVCVKVERPFLKYPELSKEYSILSFLQKYLEKDSNNQVQCPFIPKIYNYYPRNDTPSYLITQLLGSSVDTIFRLCHRRFSIMSSLILVQQMVRIIQKLHDIGIIHRNINPTEFLFCKEETTDIILSKQNKKEIIVNPSSQLYLVDYSEAKFYMKDINLEYDNNHIEFNDKVKDFSFTNKYFSSIWAELKMEQSRRDDLYSIFYILVYLLTGKLPWMGIRAKNKEDKREKIRNLKLCLSNFELCQKVNKIISSDVELFGFYLSGLSFEDKPNYNYLNQLIDEMKKKVFSSKDFDHFCSKITIIN